MAEAESFKPNTWQRTKTCKSCLSPFPVTRGSQLVCPDCRALRKSESQRRYNQKYYQQRSDELRANARLRMAEAYRDPVKRTKILTRHMRYREKHRHYLSPQELERIRRDPKLARSKREIICLVCGRGGLRRLAPHLLNCHQFEAQNYRDKFGVAQGTPLVSIAEERRMRDRWIRRRALDPRICRSPRPPRSLAQQKRGPYALEARLSRSRAIRGKAQPGKWKNGLTDEKLVKLHVEGYTNSRIARRFKLHPLSVAPRLRRLGLRGRHPVYFLGAPVTGKFVRILWVARGSPDPHVFAGMLGAPKTTVSRYLKRHQDSIPRRELAKVVLGQLMGFAHGGGRRKIPVALHDMVRTQYRELLTEIEDYMRTVTRKDHAPGRGKRYAFVVAERRRGRFLRLSMCPQFFKIGPTLQTGKLSQLVVLFLAHTYSVSGDTIERIVWARRAPATVASS